MSQPPRQPAPGASHPSDTLPCGVAVLLDDGTVLSVNARLAAMLGRPAAEFEGQPMQALLTRPSRLLYQTYLLPQLERAGEVDQIELVLTRADGSPVDVLCSATRDIQGGRAVVRCVFLRVGERRRLEHQLLTARRVADEAPGLLFQLMRDAGGALSFSYVTEAVQAMFEVTPAQAFQSAGVVWAKVHPDDAGALQEAMAQSAQCMEPWRSEFRVRLDAGQAWRELHARPRREADGTTVWSGYVADISERKGMEAGLRDKAAAERANMAKSEFLARMSHELRTPLNGIIGFTRLLQTQDVGNLRLDQLAKLGFIETAGNSLLRLINEVLEISRIESGHTQMLMEPLAVDAVIDDALRLAEPMAAERTVRLRRDESVQCCWAYADRHRLGQVLLNLLSNAIKYGPAGGHVTVHVRTLAAPAQTEGDPVHEWVDIGVQDQGSGLDEAQQAQLFQPFNRLGAEHGQVEGVGLGLVISRGLAERMGGSLLVRSARGQGSDFIIRLKQAQPPAGAADGKRAATADASAPSNPRSGTCPAAVWRVLYVEDNAINAMLMRAVFEGAPDFLLEVADSGERAGEAVARACPDVLMLDMHLPDTEGAALLARLRLAPGMADVPAIAVSADAMPDDIQRALDQGFVDYWTKPLDIARILPSLRGLLAKRAAPRGLPGGTMSV